MTVKSDAARGWLNARKPEVRIFDRETYEHSYHPPDWSDSEVAAYAHTREVAVLREAADAFPTLEGANSYPHSTRVRAWLLARAAALEPSIAEEETR